MEEISDIYGRLRELSAKWKSVVLFPPADVRRIYRSIGKLPGPFDETLLSFYRLSNGASLLDYCVAGCKNRRLVDVADHTLGLWATNSMLALDFVAFMTTSAGQEFGYLDETERNGSHVVAVLPDLSSQGVLPISSSINRFFQVVVEKLENTSVTRPEALYINDPPSWPFELREWLDGDADLEARYRAGELDKYWRSEPALVDVVSRALSARA
jgi:hypothetical protein